MKANWNAGEVGDSCTVTITDEAFGEKEFGVQEACDILTAEIASISSKDAKRIAALVALNEQKDAEIVRLKGAKLNNEVLDVDRAECRMNYTEHATERLTWMLIQYGQLFSAQDNDRMELASEAVIEFVDTHVAAAYERGASEFAEDVKKNDPELRNYVDIDEHLARFLASRGTAESKGEEG
jgi:hypothetical protein